MKDILILGDSDILEETFHDGLDELDITQMEVGSLRPYFEGVDGYTPVLILICFTSGRLREYEQFRFRDRTPYYTDAPVIAVFDMIGWEAIGRAKADLNPASSFILPVDEEDLLDRIEALL